MPSPRPTTVAEYLALQRPATRAVLKQVRAIVRKALPEAEEKISYGIPSYIQHGERVLYFAGWQEHYALYPALHGVQEAFAKRLAKYDLGVGTIRFPLDAPIPAKLIADIARFRLKWAAAREAEKRAKKAARRKKATR